MRHLPRGPSGDRQQVDCGQTPTPQSAHDHRTQGGGSMSYPARGPIGIAGKASAARRRHHHSRIITSSNEAAA